MAAMAAAENRRRMAWASFVGSRRLQKRGGREPSQNEAQSTWRASTGLVSQVGWAAAACPVSAKEAATARAPGTSSQPSPDAEQQEAQRAGRRGWCQVVVAAADQGAAVANAGSGRPAAPAPPSRTAAAPQQSQGCQCRKHPVGHTTCCTGAGGRTMAMNKARPAATSAIT